MRERVGNLLHVAAALSAAFILASCSVQTAKGPARAGAKGQTREPFVPTPVPTVPPGGTTPSVTPAPKPATPARTAKPGEPIGPEITFLGITRADGRHIEPVSVDKNGVATYRNVVGSGFQIVVEGKPGLSGFDVNRRVYAHAPDDPTMRPDLEIQVNRPLGDGSAAICDRSRPKIGGVPAIDPPSFKETRAIADTMNDLACRFEVFIESDSACSLSKYEDWAFKNPETKTQFCMMVAKAWNFPEGETLVTVRLRDTGGNPGPVKTMRVVRPKMPAVTPKARPTAKPTPKALPTR